MIKLSLTIENHLVDIEFERDQHRSVALFIRALYRSDTEQLLKKSMRSLSKVILEDDEALLVSKDGSRVRIQL